MSPDPSQLYYADPTNPQSLNLYGYVMNNPLTVVDPTGLALQLNRSPHPPLIRLAQAPTMQGIQW